MNKDRMDCSVNNNLAPIALNQNQIGIAPDSLDPIFPTEIVSKIFSYIPISLGSLRHGL